MVMPMSGPSNIAEVSMEVVDSKTLIPSQLVAGHFYTYRRPELPEEFTLDHNGQRIDMIKYITGPSDRGVPFILYVPRESDSKFAITIIYYFV